MLARKEKAYVESLQYSARQQRTRFGHGRQSSGRRGGREFSVRAPNASAVQLEIRHSDNDDYTVLNLTADPSNTDYFSADIANVVVWDQYRFLITNNHVGADNPGGLFDRVDPVRPRCGDFRCGRSGVCHRPDGHICPVPVAEF